MDAVVFVFRLFAVGLGFCWLYIAAFNAVVAWRLLVRVEQHGPSHVPLAGGICAFLGLMFWDLGDRPSGFDPRSLRFVWIPLLLDFGSLPALLLFWVIDPLMQFVRWRRR